MLILLVAVVTYDESVVTRLDECCSDPNLVVHLHVQLEEVDEVCAAVLQESCHLLLPELWLVS